MDKPTHVSLDRPKVTPLQGGLPIGAVPYGPRSSWPLIVTALWEARGTWHVLGRQVKHPSSALGSARKWCDLLLPTEASEHLEIAYRPLANGLVEVYLRIRTDQQEPLYNAEDDEDDELAAAPITPEPEAGDTGLEAAPAAPEPEAQPEPKKPRGSKHFTDDQVRVIRRMHAAGATGKSLARKYNVHESVISQLVNRVTYANVE